MSGIKLSPEKRRALAVQQRIGWRALAVAAGCWILAVVIHPMGTMAAFKVASSSLRLAAAFGLGAISLVAVLVAIFAFRPWKGKGMRTFAITLTLLALALGDVYFLSWGYKI
ncbi:MAG: hypothetical protein ABIO29_04550 [Sphingomicrobium sp.]